MRARARCVGLGRDVGKAEHTSNAQVVSVDFADLEPARGEESPGCRRDLGCHSVGVKNVESKAPVRHPSGTVQSGCRTVVALSADRRFGRRSTVRWPPALQAFPGCLPEVRAGWTAITVPAAVMTPAPLKDEENPPVRSVGSPIRSAFTDAATAVMTATPILGADLIAGVDRARGKAAACAGGLQMAVMADGTNGGGGRWADHVSAHQYTAASGSRRPPGPVPLRSTLQLWLSRKDGWQAPGQYDRVGQTRASHDVGRADDEVASWCRPAGRRSGCDRVTRRPTVRRM